MSQQTQDRRWEVDLEVDEYGEVDLAGFEEQLQREHLALAAIEHRLGGASQSYVIRQQDEQSGLWFPVKAVFKWQSFVPGIRAQPPPPQPAAAAPAPRQPVDMEALAEWAAEEGPVELSPEAEAEEQVQADYPELADGEGQWYVRGDERVLARSAEEQQELLREGFEPEPGE